LKNGAIFNRFRIDSIQFKYSKNTIRLRINQRKSAEKKRLERVKKKMNIKIVDVVQIPFSLMQFQVKIQRENKKKKREERYKK